MPSLDRHFVTQIFKHVDSSLPSIGFVFDPVQITLQRLERLPVRGRRTPSVSLLPTGGRAVNWPAAKRGWVKTLLAGATLDLFHNGIRNVTNLVTNLAISSLIYNFKIDAVD